MNNTQEDAQKILLVLTTAVPWLTTVSVRSCSEILILMFTRYNMHKYLNPRLDCSKPHQGNLCKIARGPSRCPQEPSGTCGRNGRKAGPYVTFTSTKQINKNMIWDGQGAFLGATKMSEVLPKAAVLSTTQSARLGTSSGVARGHYSELFRGPSIRSYKA